MRTLGRFVVALGLVALATPSQVGPLEDAAAADQCGDYAAKLALLKPPTDQGLAEAPCRRDQYVPQLYTL